MADSLVLKGVKEVRKQTGSELLRLNPKRGGDTHQIKRWILRSGSVARCCFEPVHNF